MNRRAAHPGRTLLLRCAAAFVAFLSLVATAPTASAGGGHDDPEITVMTRNLYLGADLSPALAAQTQGAFLLAVAQIYATAQSTNFPVRATALADEIWQQRPDLIGLQEVSVWEKSGLAVPVPETQDFLAILTSALAARGLHYTVAAVSKNADIGPVPLVAPCSGAVGDCLVTLKDRDVILVNADRGGLWWNRPRSGTYQAQEFFQPPGGDAVSFKRGWVTIDGWLKGRPFHFANTHLETEASPVVQQAQAAEFLDGPALGRGADIAVGDFNSAADGSPTKTYEQLTTVFTDAWRVNPYRPGLTCCQKATLDNPVSQLSSRIDLVLSRDGAKARSVNLVGRWPFEAVPPFWASDHAGVVATLKLDD